MEDAREIFLDMEFPILGIDMSTAEIDQRPGTSPFAVNVRAYDPLTMRRRGGSRAGLTPLFGAGSTAQVNGFHYIQSLSTIVYVSQAATPQNANNLLQVVMNYSETDHPPARNAPTVNVPFAWYQQTSPTWIAVSGVLSPADGGGTGQGTCKFKISTDGTTVTLVATFISAGFPGPYFFSGPGEVQTVTQSNANFFNPALSKLASNWTVVAGSFIGNLFFDIFVT